MSERKTYKLISINPEEGIIELAGQMNNGGYFNQGFNYSYVQEYQNKDGKTMTGQWSVLDDNGNFKVKTGGIYTISFERKKEGQNYDTLKAISEPEQTPPPKPPTPAQVVNQNANNANSIKDTATILAGIFAGVNHICMQLKDHFEKGTPIKNIDSSTFEEGIELMAVSFEQDLRKARYK